MNSWNWSYTKRKQKEMAEKSASYQQGIKGLKPLYTDYKPPPQNSDSWRREKERQHRVTVISIAIITLVCIIGIGVISYFIAYGV